MSEQGLRFILSLYREILRVHKTQLPPPMRVLGNTYVTDEFRAHLKGKTTQEQWREFAVEWKNYIARLRGDADVQGDCSGEIPRDLYDALSPDQKQRLNSLREAAQGLGAKSTAGDDPAS